MLTVMRRKIGERNRPALRSSRQPRIAIELHMEKMDLLDPQPHRQELAKLGQVVVRRSTIDKQQVIGKVGPTPITQLDSPPARNGRPKRRPYVKLRRVHAPVGAQCLQRSMQIES